MTKNYYPTFFITSASLSNGVISLSVSGSPAMSEHIHFALRFAPRVAVPSGVAIDTPVKLVIGGTTYDMLDKYGETMTFGEIPHDIFFSPRFAIVGGVGSSVGESSTTYYYIAWDVPYAQ